LLVFAVEQKVAEQKSSWCASGDFPEASPSIETNLGKTITLSTSEH
jgi:hypothetical protein